MSSVKEVLMAPGEWSLDLRPSPELDKLAIEHNFMLLYWGAELLFAGEILRKNRARSALTVGGPGLDWLLGKGKDGPIIEDRRYIAGTNKISNPAFALEDLYWNRSEGSKWVIAADATVVGDLGKDDKLTSANSFEALPGDEFELLVDVSRSGSSTGRVRGRIAFEGNYDPVDLLANGDFEDGAAVGWGSATHLAIVNNPSEAKRGDYVLRAEPIPKPVLAEGFAGWTLDADITASGSALILGPNHKEDLFGGDGDFEAGAGPWSFGPFFGISAGAAWSGSHSLLAGAIPEELLYTESFEGSFPPGTWHTYSAFGDAWAADSTAHVDGSQAAHPTTYWTGGADGKGAAYLGSGDIPLQQGTEIRIEVWIYAKPMTTPDAQGQGGISLSGPAVGPDSTTNPVKQSIQPRGRWELLTHEMTVGSDTSLDPDVALNIDLFVENRLLDPNDHWWFDRVQIFKTKGNYSYAVRASAEPVTPGQSYEMTAMVLAGWSGDLVLNAIVQGAGESVTHSTNVGAGNPSDGTNDWQEVSVQFTPDEDYTNVIASLRSEDIKGADGFFVDDIRLTQTNNVVARGEEPGTTPVEAGTSYRLEGLLSSVVGVKDGDVTIGVTLSGPGKDDVVINGSQGITKGKGIVLPVEITVADGYTTAKRFVEVKDAFTGSFTLSYLRLIQTTNNRDSIAQAATFPVTPERSYRFVLNTRSDASVTGGNIRATARFSATGRDDVVVDTSPVEATDHEWKLPSESSLTPPSGYDTCLLSLVSTDIEGGNFWIDDVSLIDQDTATAVFDAKSAASGSATLAVTATAPGGTVRVHVEVVAESEADGWHADNIDLHRTGTPVTVAEVVADCLMGPQTGTLIFTAGNIDVDPDETILFDYHARNETNGELLHTLARAGLSPNLYEYRINPDMSLDFGPASSLFTVRDDLVFTQDDLFLVDEPQEDTTAEDEVTEVKVVGAELLRPAGAPGDVVKITATATRAPSGTAVDYWGNPIRRMRVVEDSRIDHVDFAQSYADYMLSLGARKASTTHELSDYSALGKVGVVGDWIFLYDPDAGFVDAANAREYEGRTVEPAKERVLSRTIHLGSGDFSVAIFDPTSDAEPVMLENDDVLWEDATTIEVELGDFFPEFVEDPQGLSTGDQFRQFRVSSSR